MFGTSSKISYSMHTGSVCVDRIVCLPISDGETYIMRSLIECYCDDQVKEDDISGTCSVNEKEVHITF
jgi:hypothetical protein